MAAPAAPRRRWSRPLPIATGVVLLLLVALVVAGGVARATRTPSAPRQTTAGGIVVPPAPGNADTPVTRQLVWHPCGAAQCSTLTVPVDWAGGRATIPLAVLRYPATGPAAARIGSLVVDPGGPGASGVAFVRDDIASIPAAIRARFDVVGFDPRGAGASRPVRCLTDAQQDALIHLPPYPSSAAQQTAIVGGAKLLASSCATRLGGLLGHLGTVDVARDLDALRAALDEPKLTYLGYSYGTAIGADYARQFPTHVRAMVLDGALDPTADGVDLLTAQAGGFEQALDAWAAWCVGKAAACPIGAGRTSAAAVLARYDQVAAAVRVRPLTVGLRSLGPGEFTSGVSATLYAPSAGWPALGAGLADAAAGDGSELLAISDAYTQRDADGSYTSLDDDNVATNCLDRTWPRDASAYEQLAVTLAKTDPRFGPSIAYSGLPCAFWAAAPTADPAPVHAAAAPPILVVGTTGDPATPYAEAVALARQLDRGVLLTSVAQGHTSFRADASACVVGGVDAYLLDLQAPDRRTGLRCG